MTYLNFIGLKNTEMLWISNKAVTELAESSCVALKMENDGEYHYVTYGCDMKAPYICVQEAA